VFGEGHDPDASQLTNGLGAQWETLGIAIKRYAAMGALHAPLDAILDLKAAHPFGAQEVDEIDVYLSHSAYHHGWWVLKRPLTPIGAQMNVAYALAVAILDGAAMVEQFAPQRINRDDVWALIPKIRAHHDPAFDKGGASVRSTRVLVRLKDGTKLERFIALARTIREPLTNEEVAMKFRTLTETIVEPKRRAAILDRVMDLENLPEMGELSTLPRPRVGAAFA